MASWNARVSDGRGVSLPLVLIHVKYAGGLRGCTNVAQLCSTSMSSSYVLFFCRGEAGKGIGACKDGTLGFRLRDAR